MYYRGITFNVMNKRFNVIATLFFYGKRGNEQS